VQLAKRVGYVPLRDGSDSDDDEGGDGAYLEGESNWKRVKVCNFSAKFCSIPLLLWAVKQFLGGPPLQDAARTKLPS